MPHLLTFVAQGEPPYPLAYGSAQRGPAERPVATLLKTLGDARTSSLIKPARVGACAPWGGDARLQPPAPPLP
jgi:hypothetical protein